ncbi:hypothetical protein BG005_011471 [Podila minutissima]|nr:hypothetical protein BG005_011471 [Podila minutissima]
MDAGTLVFSASTHNHQTIESEAIAATLATSLESLAVLGNRPAIEIPQDLFEPRSEAIDTRKLETEDTKSLAGLSTQSESQADQMASNESRASPLPTPVTRRRMHLMRSRLSKYNRNVSKHERKSRNYRKGTERDKANNNNINFNNRRAFIKAQ